MSDEDFRAYVREQFTLMHQGFETVHGRITDLERSMTGMIHETNETVKNWTDDRMVRHKAELSTRIDGNIVATQEAARTFAAHAASPCPGAHVASGKSVDKHVEEYHDPVKTWGVIGGVVALMTLALELVWKLFSPKGGGT